MDEALLTPLFDDVGSFPLPESMSGVDVDTDDPDAVQRYLDVVEQAMWVKIHAGVEVPTYPQFRDMNRMFLDIIEDPSKCAEPLAVREESATILELEAVERVARRWRREQGKTLGVRVCITGPVELYLALFGASNYPDVLLQLARSISAFISHACSAHGLDVRVVSLDEPSLGLNPSIMLTEDDILDALDRAVRGCKADVQIHLHSPLYYELACRSSVRVVGVECASDPSSLEMIDRAVLEHTDTYLRVGIARTDIHSMAALLSERYGTNVWKVPELLEKLVSELETPEAILSRLERAHRTFGDRIRYVGPDCGLGAWPSQRIAAALLSNVRCAVDTWRNTKLK